MHDFYGGLVEFIPASSEPDRILLDELQDAMEKYDITKTTHEIRQRRNKPPLTLDEASQQVPKGLSGRKHMEEIWKLMNDDLMIEGGYYRLFDALDFKRLLVKARMHGAALILKEEADRLTHTRAPSLNSSLSAFDEDCDVVDDYSGHEFEFLVVSSC
jgi:hypothetical protein